MYKKLWMLFKETVPRGTGRLNELSVRLWRLHTVLLRLFCSLTANFPVSKPRSLMFSSYLLMQSIAINSFLHLFCFLSPPPLTFEYGADVFPDGDAATVVELAKSQLHVEERDTSEHCHQQVGQQKGTWAQTQERRNFGGERGRLSRERGKVENSGKVRGG